jgi:hypothetical protein
MNGSVVVFGINPNKLAATGMTKQNDKDIPAVRGWSDEQYRQTESAVAEISNGLTNPNVCADFISHLLHKRENHLHLSGSIIEYGI